MVRSAQGPLTGILQTLRQDLFTIMRAAIDGASASSAVLRVCADPVQRGRLQSRPVHVIAAGKAAGPMLQALLPTINLHPRAALCVSPHAQTGDDARVEWHQTSHPIPDERSVAAGRRACDLARAVTRDDTLVLLLSGGASALLALPTDGVTLNDKQHLIRRLLQGGADIHALNTLRKHISRIKGGRLAAMCDGETLTLAVSDVIGDDLSVIGSGPGVADASTWHDAARALAAFDDGDVRLEPIRQLIGKGEAGEIADTPKPGSPELRRAAGRIIAGQDNALRGARAAAEQLGYHVVMLSDRVAGEARTTARAWFAEAQRLLVATKGKQCLLSGGETTVHVVGAGNGGRNQEFALSLVHAVAAHPQPAVAASIGTDGIDGPTDAAGAVVDSATTTRAAELDLDPDSYLDANDAYAFFRALDDLIVTGPTDTNVGDIQILLTR